MLNTELEKNSAPIPEKDFFEKYGVQYVIFDIDNTILDTKDDYIKKYAEVAEKVFALELIEKGYLKEEEIEEFKKHFAIYAYQAYLNNNRPLLMDEQCYIGFQMYLKDKGINEEEFEEVDKKVEEFFSDFYITSPEISEGTLETFKYLKDRGVKIGMYSHAQRNWTEIKCEYVRRKFFEKYGEEIEIGFTSTEIEDYKDVTNWIKASMDLAFDLTKTMIVGDSLTSDFLPAISAQYPIAVWLDRKIEGKYQNISGLFDNTIAFQIKNIKYLQTMFENFGK